MFVLLVLGSSNFPQLCGDSIYEGPVLDDPSKYADKKCIIFNNIKNISKDTTSIFTQLEWIKLPDVINIAENAFSGIKTLKTVILPNVISINDSAFLNCESLTDVEIPCVKKIGKYTFKNTNISEVNASSLYVAGVEAFSNNFNLKKVRIPSMSNLEAYLFLNCPSLYDIDLTNIETIDLRCFANCYSIKSLNMTNANLINMTAINMSSLEEIIAPKVTFLNIQFENVNNLKKLIIPRVEDPTIKNLPDSIEEVDLTSAHYLPPVFENKTKLWNLQVTKAHYFSSFKGCVSLRTIYAPSAGAIPQSAFEGCTQLTYAYFPLALDVSKYSFKGCTSLKQISNNFLTIRESTFEGCESLEELELTNLNSLAGNNIFRGMKSLRKINLWRLSIINNYTGLFEGCESLEEVILSCRAPNCLEEGAFNVSKKVVNITLYDTSCYQNYIPYSKAIDGKLYFKGAYLMPAPNYTTRNVLIGVGVFVFVAIIAVVVYIIVAKRKKINQEIGETLI